MSRCSNTVILYIVLNDKTNSVSKFQKLTLLKYVSNVCRIVEMFIIIGSKHQIHVQKSWNIKQSLQATVCGAEQAEEDRGAGQQVEAED